MAIGLCGWVLTWFLPERPLRETVAHSAGGVGMEMGEAFPMPGDDEMIEPGPTRRRG
jgi:hypothetical protein